MGAPWPHDTMEKLKAAGYTFEDTSKCLSPTCSVTVHWFITPNKKWMPFDAMLGQFPSGDDRLQPHFGPCPESRRFSRKGEPGKTTTEERA